MCIKPDSYNKYRFQAKETTDIMKQWNKKMAALEEHRFDKKKLIKAKKEKNKLRHLNYCISSEKKWHKFESSVVF